MLYIYPVKWSDAPGYRVKASKCHNEVKDDCRKANSVPDGRCRFRPAEYWVETVQCQLLNLNRSTVYYQPVGVSDEDLKLMRLIDEIHLKRPFYGSRRIRDDLQDLGYPVNCKRVQRLMRKMGIMALYPKVNTSRPGKGHKIYPYLLRGLTIDRPNQVWATDLTYIPMARGFVLSLKSVVCNEWCQTGWLWFTLRLL